VVWELAQYAGKSAEGGLGRRTGFNLPFKGDYEEKIDGRKVLKTPRRSFPRHQPQDEAQIKPRHVNQQPFQNILATTKMNAPHPSRFIAVSEGPFQHQPALS
jgi:hypothetical protein